MTKEEERILRKEIKTIKELNIEETLKMANYCLEAYLKTLITFKQKSQSTKNVKNIWAEYIINLKEEYKILNTIITNSKDKELEKIELILDILDKINEESIIYYYENLDRIEDACDLKNDSRSIPYKKNFKTLTESKELQKQLTKVYK